MCKAVNKCNNIGKYLELWKHAGMVPNTVLGDQGSLPRTCNIYTETGKKGQDNR